MGKTALQTLTLANDRTAVHVPDKEFGSQLVIQVSSSPAWSGVLRVAGWLVPTAKIDLMVENASTDVRAVNITAGGIYRVYTAGLVGLDVYLQSIASGGPVAVLMTDIVA